MTDAKRTELVPAIRDFVTSSTGPGSSDRKRTLHSWQRLIGWCNWALNAYPLLNPSLQSSYEKIRGKTHPLGQIFLNRSVIRDLSWFADRVETSQGINIMEMRHWDSSDAEVTFLTDATLTGLVFWAPALDLAFVAPITPDSLRYGDIFFNEALTIVSALSWSATLCPSPRRVLIRTDSMNCVDIFHSLSTIQSYNQLLLHSVQVLKDSKISLRVVHIPGEQSTVADALSRGLFNTAVPLHPHLRIQYFMPLRNELGAVSQ